jgi:hypothetical protein
MQTFGKTCGKQTTRKRKSSEKQPEMVGTTGKSTSKDIVNPISRKKQDSWLICTY